jgi:hypothetical protein
MKKLSGLKNINTTFTDTINELYTDLNQHLKEIKHEYQHNIIDEKIKLLVTICNGEGLDLNEIKQKYLKPKELEYFEPDVTIKNETIIDENLLDKIKINNQYYYYEPIKDGNVYNIHNENVGVYNNGLITFK